MAYDDHVSLARTSRGVAKALAEGRVTRRDLFRWGLMTAGGALTGAGSLAALTGRAQASSPPRSPLFGVTKFSQPFRRLNVQQPVKLTPNAAGDAAFPATSPELPARRLSYHTEFTASGGTAYVNPVTGRGPLDGRPPGEMFAHQRWNELTPKSAYVMSMGQIAPGIGFHPGLPAQQPNSVWSFGSGRNARGTLPAPLIKARYGEPIITRIYNNLPVHREDNGGFGRNELALHLHNGHNAGESDGASNAFHFPGTFFDYLWTNILARHDRINTGATNPLASGPDDGTGLVPVKGDFRELLGSMWFHDHRFFFTAENVYKGSAGAVNFYSGKDRGNEALADGVNLQLPSGSLLGWGNVDFDINIMMSDAATDADGQLHFDIFDTDGFLGDLLLANQTYAPFLEVLPRKYRLRTLNACQARWLKLALVNSAGKRVPMTCISNDGNLLAKPVTVQELDAQGNGERYDVVIDFSTFRVGERLRLVNLMQQTNGRRPDGPVALATALKGVDADPVVGPFIEFRVVSAVQSVDVPGITLTAADPSRVPAQLTEQIPIVTPVRERLIEVGRGNGDSRAALGGQCIPDCSEVVQGFPWIVKVNKQGAHGLNANRISHLIPKPGDVEHWTLKNGSGGWSHPMHLHFEEGVLINRGSAPVSAIEKGARKDIFRLGPGEQVKIQVQFGEFGGAYVSHCHNTAHEDFAMLERVQVIGNAGTPQAVITSTPNPTPDGVFFTTPEILPEADPRNAEYFKKV
jgi:FtsP/CotA-like multicopper oxidase with cupredoxin domain